MADLKTYSPKDISVIIGGTIASGYADGTFVSVGRNVDAMTLTIGADGEGTRTKSPDLSGKFTLTLKQTSEMNAILSAFAEQDELSSSGTFPVLIKDAEGLSIHGAEIAWIMKKPDSSYGKELDTREWIIETHSLKHFIGGN